MIPRLPLRVEITKKSNITYSSSLRSSFFTRMESW